MPRYPRAANSKSVMENWSWLLMILSRITSLCWKKTGSASKSCGPEMVFLVAGVLSNLHPPECCCPDADEQGRECGQYCEVEGG